MTVRHRRRSLQAETVAPWVALSVILLLWWAGARTLSWMIPNRVIPAAERTIDRVKPEVSAVDASPTATVRLKPDPTYDRRSTSESEAVAPTISPDTPVSNADVSELRTRHLTVPVRGIEAGNLASSFDDSRGQRVHEAIDILAPRGTPVLAVEDGKVAKLFTCQAGGLTVYQYDPSEEFIYYYAHLDSYASGLKEGQELRRGNVIGYVGTTGNAPENTPHLHFAIAKLDPDKKWWGGTALDPFLVWRNASAN